MNLNKPWAYSGSIAMKLHAKRLGMNLPRNRKIGNINIAVENPVSQARILRGTGMWNYVNVPGPNAKHVTMKNSKNTKLNLFKIGGNFVPRGSIVKLGNVNVVNLNTLLAKKRNIAKNLNTLRPNNRKKTLNNINFLQRLINASKNRSPLVRRNRASPSPSPVKRRRGNNYRTPSPPRGRRLFGN
jgi:hypothetical protein